MQRTTTALACLSVPGCRVALPVLEALTVGREELDDALADLRDRSGADQVCLLSTCERTEVYATWTGEADVDALARALARNRGLPLPVVEAAADRLTGSAAARHLLRVTAGLESFVLGERDIVGQVRSAGAASQAAGVSGLELERLLATAVNTSRRVHRSTRFGDGGRSVAAAAVHLAAAANGGELRGRQVLVVGAGQVATEAAATAARLGATVTVCNRTKRHAERLAAAGARVVDLGRLLEVLPGVDVAVFGTAAPHRLLEAGGLAGRTGGRDRDLLLLDLCVPRNVDPAVRSLPGVDLVDLADLRSAGAEAGAAGEGVSRDVARAEEVVAEELDRYSRWLAGRSAAVWVRRLRADVDVYADNQARHAGRGVPEELRPAVEEGVRRAVRRLAHGPTKRLLAAAEAGDEELVEVLSGLFADSPGPRP
jgi:glutamyl-tRNA reductase